jgi:hypothetical protein
LQQEVAAWDAHVEERRAAEAQLAEDQINMRQMVANSAIGFLGALGSKHRGAAIAALAIQKALAVKEILIQSQVAQMRALAELGPIAGAPVAAAIAVKGKISAALVAATGLVEAAQLSSGGVQSTLGTSANPISTRSSTATSAIGSMDHRQKVVEVHFNGDMHGFDSYVRDKVIAGIREAVDGSDVVLFSAGSRQAQLLSPA